MKKVAGFLFFVVLISLLFFDVAHAQSARDLNTEGYRLYGAGKYPEALECFTRAVAADPNYALAHYNLACTLGVLRKRGGESICTYDAYKSTILDHLEAAIHLDPDTLMRMGSEPDLDTIRNTIRYLRLTGLSPDNEDDIKTILVTVTWFGPSPGAFGPTSSITFHEDGTLTLWTLDTTGNEPKRIDYRGECSVTANRITITLETPLDGTVQFIGTIMPGGTLDLPGLPGPFNDDPHECEA